MTSLQQAEVNASTSATCSTISDAMTTSKYSAFSWTKSSTRMHLYWRLDERELSSALCSSAIWILSWTASIPSTSAPRRPRGLRNTVLFSDKVTETILFWSLCHAIHGIKLTHTIKSYICILRNATMLLELLHIKTQSQNQGMQQSCGLMVVQGKDLL